MSRLNIEENEDDGVFEITCPYDQDCILDLKESLSAKWNRDKKVWEVDSEDFSEASIEIVLKLHFPREFR